MKPLRTHVILSMQLPTFVTMFSALYALVVALDPGTIEKPANGSVIGPNSVFDFKYWIRADYSVSSYAFSVWLMTEMPGSFSPSEVWSTGHYFGRFDEANYPGESIAGGGSEFVWLNTKSKQLSLMQRILHHQISPCRTLQSAKSGTVRVWLFRMVHITFQL